MKATIRGIHHVTALSGHARENFAFYTGILGLRLVKKTINFDDPSVYHLYYGDRTGRPGTLMTFFTYGGAPGRRGPGQVVSISYPVADLESWKGQLRDEGVKFKESDRFGAPCLTLDDPHGMALELFQAPDGADGLALIGGATIALNHHEPTTELLEFLGYRREKSEGGRTRFRAAGGKDFLDLLVTEAPPGTGGAGTVHHIALRLPHREAQLEWRRRLLEAGYQVSEVMDRNYFHSIYFRGPEGVLFELATDPPGMLVDETEEDLGAKLMLPPRYEAHRHSIEEALEPLDPQAGTLSE